MPSYGSVIIHFKNQIATGHILNPICPTRVPWSINECTLLHSFRIHKRLINGSMVRKPKVGLNTPKTCLVLRQCCPAPIMTQILLVPITIENNLFKTRVRKLPYPFNASIIWDFLNYSVTIMLAGTTLLLKWAEDSRILCACLDFVVGVHSKMASLMPHMRTSGNNICWAFHQHLNLTINCWISNACKCLKF